MEGERRLRDNSKLREVQEQLIQDLELMRELVTERMIAVRDTISLLVDEHPYGAVAGAFGLGYILAGGLFSRATLKLLRVGGRVLWRTMLRQGLAATGLNLLTLFGAEPHRVAEGG